jgi:hypothetical protein
MVAKSFEDVRTVLPDVELYYDPATTSAYGRGTERFLDAKLRADIIILYSGKSAFLDDITYMERNALIQPLDTLSGFREAIHPETFHKNGSSGFVVLLS